MAHAISTWRVMAVISNYDIYVSLNAARLAVVNAPSGSIMTQSFGEPDGWAGYFHAKVATPPSKR